MDKCLEVCNDKEIVFADLKGRSRMRFINSKKRTVSKYKVDGCLILDGIRCDYLLVDNNSVEYFIELKGSDIIHACKQIERTIEKLSKSPQLGKKFSFIVSNSCPLTTTQVQNIQVYFKKMFNAILKVKNRECCHNL